MIYKSGDPVVYVVSKHSDHPGPRAESVQPEPNGEGYSYAVKKYWRIVEVDRQQGTVSVMTRRGKARQIRIGDPQLRLASWWERLLLSSRFPAFNGPADTSNSVG